MNSKMRLGYIPQQEDSPAESFRYLVSSDGAKKESREARDIKEARLVALSLQARDKDSAVIVTDNQAEINHPLTWLLMDGELLIYEIKLQ